MRLAVIIALSFVELNCATAQDLSKHERDRGASAEDLADEAHLALRRKDHEKAASLLRRAIAANPDDLGLAYGPRDTSHIDEGSLRYGQSQLENMLKDRPLMRRHIQPSDELWTWTRRKYAMKIDGSRIEWDPAASARTDGSEYEPPNNGTAGKIRVGNLPLGSSGAQAIAEWAKESDDLCIRGMFELHTWAMGSLPIIRDQATAKEAKTFDRLWSLAIFELHNI